MLKIFVASCREVSHSRDMQIEIRTIRTVHGYQGFSVTVNGVTVSTLVCHGDPATGDWTEREYTVGDGIRSLWHPTDSPFESSAEIGTRVNLPVFREICHRHGLTFSARKF